MITVMNNTFLDCGKGVSVVFILLALKDVPQVVIGLLIGGLLSGVLLLIAWLIVKDTLVQSVVAAIIGRRGAD